MQNDRHFLNQRPTLAEQQTIKKILAPKTAEDLLLALQHPESPIFKDYISMIHEKQLDARAILEQIITQAFITENKMKDTERQALIDAIIAKEKNDQPIRNYYEAQIASYEKSLTNTNYSILKERIDERETLIKQLQNAIQNQSIKLQEIQNKGKQSTEEWRKITEQDLENCINHLNQQGIHQFNTANNTQISITSETGQKIIALFNGAIKESPSSFEKMSRIAESHYQANRASSSKEALNLLPGSIPPPPQLPILMPSLQHPPTMMAQNSMINELKALMELAKQDQNPDSGENFGRHMLKTQKENRPIFSNMQAIQNTKEHQEKHLLHFKNVASTIQEKIQVINQLQHYKNCLGLNETLQEKETMALTQLLRPKQ